MTCDVMLYYRWEGLQDGYVLCHQICKKLPNLFRLPSKYNQWHPPTDCDFILCSKLSCSKNEVKNDT